MKESIEFDNNVDSIIINEVRQKYNFQVMKDTEYVKLYLNRS